MPKIGSKFKKTKQELIGETKDQKEDKNISSSTKNDDLQKLYDLNLENLKTIYFEYVETFMSRDKQSLFNLMRVVEPYINEKVLMFTFQSEQQRQSFEEIRPEVLGYINQRLKDKLEAVDVEIDDSIKLGMDKPYTPSEQLDYMLSKSPILKEAMDKLDLRLK